jgi:hypothetical protein
MRSQLLSGISQGFPLGIPVSRAGYLRVTHPFAADALLHPLDLHVLGTPPAFILSQDQTLKKLDLVHFKLSGFDSLKNRRFSVCCQSV